MHAWTFSVKLFSDLHLWLQNGKRQERFTTFSDRSYLNSLSSCKRGMDYKKTKTKEIYTKLPRNHPLNLHTHPHTNADWTPTDHYHWWHMMALFNWSLIANDVMDRKMNMHWSRAARYDRRKRHYKAFSIESFKSCTMIYRRNIYMQNYMHTKLTTGEWEHC